eukprot:15436093-Alexandrium_andersonii.AAC.1
MCFGVGGERSSAKRHSADLQHCRGNPQTDVPAKRACQVMASSSSASSAEHHPGQLGEGGARAGAQGPATRPWSV